MQKPAPHRLDLDYSDLLPVFDGIGEGVIIVDRGGTIIYYNDAMAAIDELRPADALLKQVTEVYDLTPETSIIMQCLKGRAPIVNHALIYRTRMGKVANTLHTVFPLFKNAELRGAICLVREYNVLEETIAAVSIPPPESRLPNDTRFIFEDIVGEDPEFQRMLETAKMAADTPSPIMLFGETGTGKELVAQAIHNASGRSKQRYTPVNCAAIPENLLEGILFGTTPGAFTGAQNKPGLFERASGGTIFLDEVNSMAPGLQAKILRVIQEYKVRRLGSVREIGIDLKIISSVNKEPHVAIAEKSLRADLFYRLGVVFIAIPPLRRRPADIVHLTHHFLRKHSRALNKRVSRVSDDVTAFFQQHPWPGNVRELEHVIEGALNLVDNHETTIELSHLRLHLPTWYRLREESGAAAPARSEKTDFPGTAESGPTVSGANHTGRADPGSAAGGRGLMAAQAAAEQRALKGALEATGGNISHAARRIGISRQLFGYKMKKHGIDRADHRPPGQGFP
jgi:arginine utilization regulatory protein